MFTGIIEELGAISAVTPLTAGARLRISCSTVLGDARTGVSIAVNGVCLTAVDLQPGSFAADLAPETLSRSNLGMLREGDAVNLERPLLPTSRLSGHIVQGHVDGTAEITDIRELGGNNWWLELRIPPALTRYFVEKGSICVDGISLTIAALQADRLAMTIIPHTWVNTNLHRRRTGDRLNLEVDVLAKHVERLLASTQLGKHSPGAG